jgi:hypothetical protein
MKHIMRCVMRRVMRRVYDAHYEVRYERLYPTIMQAYSCCYAKLYVIVHMGYPGMPGGKCPGDTMRMHGGDAWVIPGGGCTLGIGIYGIGKQPTFEISTRVQEGSGNRYRTV